MTTASAAARYLSEHLARWGNRPPAVYNPRDKTLDELPIIYGFNNGGAPDFLSGVLLAEDGAGLGGHICSAEGYMLYDLGIVEGSKPDRHERFRKHYPDGYRMEFVALDKVLSHAGLTLAYERNQRLAKEAQ